MKNKEKFGGDMEVQNRWVVSSISLEVVHLA